MDEQEHDYLMRGAAGYQISSEKRSSLEALFQNQHLDDASIKEFAAMSSLKSFQTLAAHVQANREEWRVFLTVEDVCIHLSIQC